MNNIGGINKFVFLNKFAFDSVFYHPEISVKNIEYIFK